MLLDRRAAPSFVVLTAIDLTPGPSGLRSGWSANSGDFRAAFFHPDCTVGPGMGLRLHRVMWLTPLAGFTADRGVSPLPRRTGSRIHQRCPVVDLANTQPRGAYYFRTWR